MVQYSVHLPTYWSRRRMRKVHSENTSGGWRDQSPNRVSTNIHAWKSQQTMKTAICETQSRNARKEWSQRFWKHAQQITKDLTETSPRWRPVHCQPATTPIRQQQCKKLRSIVTEAPVVEKKKLLIYKSWPYREADWRFFGMGVLSFHPKSRH